MVQGVTVTSEVLDSNNCATGVKYVHSRDTRLKDVKSMEARREVIVADGPYGSLKLFQLLGIGPREVLQRAGIKARVELPLGERSQGRALASFSSLCTGVKLAPVNNLTELNDEARRQFEKGGGRGGGGVYAMPVTSVKWVKRLDGYGTGGFVSPPVLGANVPLVVSVRLGSPNSLGYVRVRDADPFSTPAVHTNLLGKRVDLQRLRRLLHRIGEVHEKLDERFNVVNITPMGAKLNESYVLENADFGLHFKASCRVGPVVTDTLKVHGVKGLRVIDTSVLNRMPPSAGSMALVYMIAEYAGYNIVCAYNCKRWEAKACATEKAWL